MSRWTDKWLNRWPAHQRLRLGTTVTVTGQSGNFTVAGYDFANRKYRVLKVIPDPPSRVDLMVAESAVAVP